MSKDDVRVITFYARYTEDFTNTTKRNLGMNKKAEKILRVVEIVGVIALVILLLSYGKW